jgi:hypothetical protein
MHHRGSRELPQLFRGEQMKNSSEYNHEYYVGHKEKVIKRLKDRAKTRRAAIRAAKNKPCADCGIQYDYWIMQFDHVTGKKSFNIGYGMWKIGLKRILEEIAKCEIVCANCHADRTYRRQKSTPLSAKG